MPFNELSFRGSGNDWDPATLSDEDKTAEDLAALGMHTVEEGKEKEEDEDDGTGEVEKVATVVVVEVDEDEDDVDERKVLERLEKELQAEEKNLEEVEEE